MSNWLAVLVATACMIFISPTALAVGPGAITSGALKLSPVRADLEIRPGESGTIAITIVNLTNETITVHPAVNDFISADERGTPSLILDENNYAPTHSLKRFIGSVEDVVIAAGQAKSINVTIAVPADAQAGGYFGAIRFSPLATSDSQVNVNASMASLVLLTVAGDVVEKLTLTDFAVQQNGTANDYFGDSDNLQLATRFENKGGLQLGPVGKVSVKVGSRVIYEADFNNNNPREVVLPDGARRWDVPLDNIGGFGNYTVTATFTYGKNNQTIEATKSFWIIPLQTILVMIGAGVLLIVVIGMVLFARYRRAHRSLHFGNRNR